MVRKPKAAEPEPEPEPEPEEEPEAQPPAPWGGLKNYAKAPADPNTRPGDRLRRIAAYAKAAPKMVERSPPSPVPQPRRQPRKPQHRDQDAWSIREVIAQLAAELDR